MNELDLFLLLDVDFSFNGFFSDGPSVSIKLGEPLDLNNIEEGHDVYFTCKIDSNPSPKIVDWNYNVSLTFKHTYYWGKCLCS